MRLREELGRVVQDLLGRSERTLSLDTVADAIGAMPITSDEIGLIFDELEASGRVVAEGPVAARESLDKVLRSARKLRAELGRSPSSNEIATESGLSLDAVRLALLFARMLQR
ncbi:MAG TPA: sigma-70 domain-containing protein [Polyangiaceae bacterium]|nr:sigma-70 domain-containing protein [Polyangiaceae bacterium]